MSRYIPEPTRQIVIERADSRCEYCKIYERFSFLDFHIEHIIAIKHGGLSILENLAYSCCICNLSKGSDIATFIKGFDDPVRFFHPRKDNWDDHFEVDKSGLILPKTNIGKATVKILDMNHTDAIIERHTMLVYGVF